MVTARVKIQPGSPFYTELNNLRNKPRQLVDALLEYRARLAAIDKNPLTSDLAKSQEKQAAREAFMAKLDSFAEAAKSSGAVLRNRIESALNPKVSTDEALLMEIRQQRAWERARQLLEAGKQPLELIQRAADAKDTDTLTAFAVELPTWLEARQSPPQLIKAMMVELKKAWRPLMDDKQGMASDVADEVNAGMMQWNSALAMVREEVTSSGWGQNTMLPAWESKQAIRVAPEAKE